MHLSICIYLYASLGINRTTLGARQGRAEPEDDVDEEYYEEYDDDAEHVMAVAATLGRAVKVKVSASAKQLKKQREQKLKGREPCGCFASAEMYSDSQQQKAQASGHRLFMNCTVCGRIHCTAEGEGPWYTLCWWLEP